MSSSTSYSQIFSYLGGAHWLTCLVESNSVPTYVLPRHVTLITRTPERKRKLRLRNIVALT